MVRAMARDYRKRYGFCIGVTDEVTRPRHPGRTKERPNYVRTDKDRVHPDCSNALNPYHVCTKDCGSIKFLPSSESNPCSNGESGPDVRTNKLEMKVEEETSHVKDHSRDQTRFHLADVLSLTSVHSSKISDASWNDESVRSIGDRRSQSKYHDPRLPRDCKEEDDPGSAGSARSDISAITVVFEDGNEDDRCVVEEGNSSILHSILEQRGDIAADCVLQSSHLRSCYLDAVCSIVRELHSTAFMVASRSRAEEISSILADIESSQIDVSWLRRRLDDILETMKLVSENRVLKMAKAECDRVVDSAKEEVGHLVQILRDKKGQVAATEALLSEAEHRLNQAEEESVRLNLSYDVVRSKVEKLNSFNSLLSSGV